MKLLLSFALMGLLFTSSAFGLIELNFGKTKFIAAVLKSKYGIEVWINTRKYWLERGALTDSYSPEDSKEIEMIVEQVRLCNLAESQYEPCREGRSILQVKTDLMQAGVEIDTAFQKWAEKEISRP